MPRPRKPTALHLLQGTRPNACNRDRSAEPTPTGPLGPPPKGMPRDAAKCWREIAAALAPGVAGNSDRVCVEIVARLLAKLRSPEGLRAAELSCLHRGLASLGMTPAARSKVAPPPGEKPGPSGWDALGPRS